MGSSCFVAGWIGSTNLGDELIFAALRAKLQAAGVTDIICASRDPQTTGARHGVRTVSHMNPLGHAQAIQRSDMTILGGGGLLQDQTSPFNLPYHLSRPLWARLVGRPHSAIGISAGPLRRPFSASLIRAATSRAASIIVRDKLSAIHLKKLGVKNVRTACDLVYSLDVPRISKAGEEIVVCLRPILRRPGFLPVSIRGEPIDEEIVVGFAKALDATVDRFGLPIRFVAFEADRDDAFQKRVAARMQTTSKIVIASMDDVFEQVGRGRVVISMRFHGGVVASRLGRPVVLIDHSPKLGSLGEELGNGAATLKYTPDELSRIPDAVAAVIGHDEDVQHAVERIRGRDEINDEAVYQLTQIARPAPHPLGVQECI